MVKICKRMLTLFRQGGTIILSAGSVVQGKGNVMPRKNYMTINANETVQQMFNEFVECKELKKTVALNDMLEMYMLAKDEDLYLKLKRKYLNVESVRQMIEDRDSNDLSVGEENFIFMKLAISQDNQGNEYNGHETMQLYMADQVTRGHTWFSTQALYYGMSPKRVKDYNKAIQLGKKVTILFAIGRSAGGNNDIAYKADVLEIQSYTVPEELPVNEYPKVWHGAHARIWMKLENIVPEDTLTATLFQITSTGMDLQEVINNSQYHFGYISLK